jgi:hypothetical protein
MLTEMTSKKIVHSFPVPAKQRDASMHAAVEHKNGFGSVRFGPAHVIRTFTGSTSAGTAHWPSFAA